MSITNFNKVFEFCRAFGQKTTHEIDEEVFTKDPKLIKLRYDLIKEEVDELREALDNHDMKETIDALADILYVVYGAGVQLGIDLDKAMGLVHESNMTKLCKTEDEAKETVLWYKDQYANKSLPYDSPAYRKADIGDYWVVFNSSTGKILKSINYHPVSFDNMLKKQE